MIAIGRHEIFVGPLRPRLEQAGPTSDPYFAPPLARPLNLRKASALASRSFRECGLSKAGKVLYEVAGTIRLELRMGLRRGYVIALAVAVIAAVASIAIPKGANGLDPEARALQAADALARRHLPEAMAALQRLAVPRDFRRITAGCMWYRCYVVPERTTQAAPELRGILRSIGALNARTRLLQARMRALGAVVNRVEAPVYQHVHVAAPKVTGCSTVYNPREGVWTRCAYPAIIADNNIAVFLGPYLACHPRPCRWTNESEVAVTAPSGSSRAPQ